MKILYHHRTRSYDGQFVHIDALVSALRALGHEVVTVGPRAASSPELRATPWYRRRVPRVVSELLEFGYSFVALARLLKAYRRHRPDILYERYNLFLPAGIWLKKLTGVPMIAEVNAPLAKERAETSGLSAAWLARWSERSVWRGADAVLPVTEVLARTIVEAGAEPGGIVIIPNGIDREILQLDLDVDSAKRRLGLQGRLVLGFTGFVRPWHGLDRVLELMAEIGGEIDCSLLVVGDGPARPALEEKARRLGVADRVVYTGVLDRARVAEHVLAFDVALQPDVTPYASPLKLFEYMALAKPIVAPATPNIQEVLENERTALLFDRSHPDAFAQAIRRLCRDRELRAALGCAARATIVGRDMTWDGNARRVSGLAERLCRSRTSASSLAPSLDGSRERS